MAMASSSDVKIDVSDDASGVEGHRVLMLRHEEHEEPLAHMLVMPRAGNHMMYGSSVHKGLPMSAYDLHAEFKKK